MVKRYYFHLADRYNVIPDEGGIEVANLARAGAWMFGSNPCSATALR
jgi:hypothetical protein